MFDISSHSRRQPSWKARLALGLESLKVTAFVTFATFLALFMDDFRLACLPTSLDNPCQYISLGVMVSLPPFDTLCVETNTAYMSFKSAVA